MKRHLFSALLLVFAFNPLAEAASVALDSGHTPLAPGVRGSCGGREVDYNDAVTDILRRKLAQMEIDVRLTRQLGQQVIPGDRGNGEGRESRESLRRRVQNAGNADILLSIHHDAVNEAHLETVDNLCGNRPGTRFKDSFKHDRRVSIGFNVFVSGSRNSQRLGREIGRRLREAGLTASNYHSERWEPGQGATPVDEENGLWRKGLFIVNQTPMPAVLIEIHPIVDPEYEQKALSPEFRETVVNAISEGVEAYFGG